MIKIPYSESAQEKRLNAHIAEVSNGQGGGGSKKYTHILTCTQNSEGDGYAFVGVVRFTNDVSTPYTSETITNQIIGTNFDSIGGVVKQWSDLQIVAGTMDNMGTIHGYSTTGNDYDFRTVNFKDTTTVTFTDTVISV